MSRAAAFESATHEYIGRAKCGCCLSVCVDLGDSGTANNVADFIRDGLYVERVTREQFRTEVMREPTFMKCPHGQLRMLEDGQIKLLGVDG